MQTYSIPETNRKFWLAIVGSISLFVALSGYLYYEEEANEIRQHYSKELSSIADFKTSQISHWYADRISDVMFHVQSPLFNRAADDLARNPSNNVLRSQMRSRLRITKGIHNYENVLFVSPEGNVIVSIDSTVHSIDEETKHDVQNVLTQQQICLCDLSENKKTGGVYMDFVAPVGTDTAKPVAAIIFRINPTYDLYPLVEWWPHPSKSNQSLLVRREADSVVFISGPPADQTTFYRMALTDTTIPAVKAVLGYEGELEGKDYRGVQVLASVKKIPETPWHLVVKVNVDEMYSEVYYRGQVTFILLTLLILAVASSIGSILYYRQRNVFRDRYQAETKLREEHEEFRTTLYSIGDGVITTDTEGKIRQMNAVAERLTGWKEVQAVDMPIDNVFVIHNEENGAPAFNPVYRVLKEGTIVGMTNHTVLVAKDGSHHPISESGAPIYDPVKKHIVGVVLVFRDQTNERRTQRALRESQEKFKQLFEAESDAIVMVDVASGKIIEANEAACSLYRFTRDELLTKKNTDLSAEPEETDRLTRATKADKENVIFVPLRYHKRKDGSVFPTEITGRFFPWQKRTVYIAAIRDITLRLKTEESLRKSESLLRVSQWIAKIGSYELDLSTGRWTNTQALDEIFGISESYERTVEGWGNLIHPDDRDAMLKYFTNDVITARGKFHREYRIIRQSDKEIRWVLGIGGLIMDTNNTPVQMVGVIQDITERKQNELVLQKSEESYHGLFNSVQDAIYIQDANGVFLDVNEGAVAMYGYRREEFIGKTPEFVSAPGKNNIEQVAVLVQKAYAGEPQQFEFWGKRANGEIFPKEVRLYKGSYFGKDVIIAVAQDISKRKYAEEILRASEERYRKLIDTSPDAIAITDLNGNILFTSSRTLELFGGTTDLAQVGKNVLAWIDPAHHNRAIKGIRDVFTDTVNTDNQYKLVRENGTTFFGEINAAPLLDANGEPEGMVALIRDITKRKEAEEFLRKFSLVVEQSSSSVVITDKNGTIEYVNSKFSDVTGYTREETIGQNPRVLKSGLTPPETYREMWNNLKNGIEWRGELLNKKKNGELFWEEVVITPLINESGETVSYVALKEDITARKRSEDALARREALEKELVSLSTSFVNLQHKNSDTVFNFVLERVGKFSLADRAYIFRYDKKRNAVSNTHEWAAEGITPEINNSQNFAYEDAPRWMDAMLQHQNVHIPSVDLLPDYWRKEKEIFTSQQIKSLLAVPLLYSNELLGFIGFDSVRTLRTWEEDEIRLVRILADLFAGTIKRLQTEDEKSELEQQVQQIQKLESIGTLASGIAHDFNNILGIIMAHVSILDRVKTDETKFGSGVDTILKTINRGASLVRQILTFARKTATNLEYVNVNKAVTEIQKMVAETFPKTISITLKLEKAIPILMVDSTQFNQSLLNLCVNARDAMNDQGSLIISTQLVRGEDIATKFPAASTRDFVAVSVRDSGAGIDDVYKDKVFEPFFTTKDKGKGTGLGLSVVFGVMQNHNGFVDLESEKGKGTTFTLYFPIPDGIIQHETVAVKLQDDVQGGNETILFVEDEDSLTDIARMLLENKGYTLITAKNGEEGFQLFGKHRDKIDLIISDVGMPIMSGEKMYEMIKRISPAVKIIFATGYIEPSVKESLLQSGAKEFIQKPYNNIEFLRKVRDVLDKELT